MQKIQAVTRGSTSDGETRDCTVRALSNASGMHYDNAHALLKKHCSQDRRRCFVW